MTSETLSSIRPQRVAAWALLAVTLALNAAALRPELSIGRLDLNDNILHLTIVERMVQAIERGENPLDCWVSEWTPRVSAYQGLSAARPPRGGAPLLRAREDGVAGDPVRLGALSVARPAARERVRQRAAARSRASSGGRGGSGLPADLRPARCTGSTTAASSGAEAGSTRSCAPRICMFWSLGLSYRALRHGRLLAPTGIVLGLTFLAHFIYGWMAAVSIVLLAVLPDRSAPRSLRLVRAGIVGLVAAVLTAFQTLVAAA